MNNQQMVAQVTTKIIEQLKAGVKPWECVWDRAGGQFGIPRNVRTGENYRGINIPILWEATSRKGYTTDLWVGYTQAQELGGHVRKDEKSTYGMIYKPLVVEDEDGEVGPDGKRARTIPLFKTFYIFNLDQVEGLDHLRPPAPTAGEAFEPIPVAEELLKKSHAQIIENGARAFYRKSNDQITLPDRWRFKVAEDFYATGLHELTHWTGHKSRLDRTWGQRFGDDAYAFEELVAEMGSAFLCSKLGLKGELQHESYIGGWLKILQQDYRALVRAASQAQKAFDYLNALVEEPKVDRPEAERLAA